MVALDTLKRIPPHINLVLLIFLALFFASGCRGQVQEKSTAQPSPVLATRNAVQLPDLRISSIQMQGGSPDSCPPAGGPYNFTVVVANQGSAHAGTFTVRFNRQYHQVDSGLLAGDTLALTFVENTLQPGVEIDSRNDVYEREENNNFTRAQFTAPTPAPHCQRTPTPAVELLSPLAVLQGHTDRVLAVEFSPDSNMIASGSVDNSLRLWRTDGFSLLRTMQGHPFPILDLVFSPDGAMLATGSTDGLLRMWRVTNGQLVFTMQGHAGQITSLDYSSDGKFLLSSAQDFTVRVWRAIDARLVQTIDEGLSMVNQAIFSPESTRLAWGEQDGTVRVRTLDGTWLHIIHSGVENARCVAFTPSGELLAAGFENGTILVWQLPGGNLVQTIEAHGSQISQLDFSPDGTWLAAGSYDGLVSLWEKKAFDAPFQIRLIYEGHAGAVNSIAFSPDGTLLSSAGDDATVRVWPVPEK